MSDTPLTDRITCQFPNFMSSTPDWVPTEHARRMERDRARLLAALESLLEGSPYSAKYNSLREQAVFLIRDIRASEEDLHP